MRYTKPIELWGKEAALRSGALKLQKGQHVTCGGTKARFVKVHGLAIWVAHDEKDFKALCLRWG